jgi:hypothetical protein
MPLGLMRKRFAPLTVERSRPSRVEAVPPVTRPRIFAIPLGPLKVAISP